jgi:hypothetical protein
VEGTARGDGRDKTARVFLGLTRGEAALALVVFALVYAGVVLPRLGERLGVFLAGRQTKNKTATTHPPNDGDHQG